MLENARADRQRNYRAIADVLLRWADWHTDLSRPTHAVIAEQTGLSLSTVARGLHWLTDHGFALLTQAGATPRYAPQLLASGDHNLAATYQLAMPVDESDDPSCVFNLVVTPTRAQGKINPEAKATDRPPAAPRREHKRTREQAPSANWGPSRRALRREWHRQQAAQLQERAPALRRISDTHAASIIRPWLNAGYTVESLAYGLDHRPDGTKHTSTDPVRSPAGWLRWRLAYWRGPDGTVLPSRRQQLVAADEARLRRNAADLDVIYCRIPIEEKAT